MTSVDNLADEIMKGLTEYAELGKMRLGAARTAGGQHFPEGR